MQTVKKGTNRNDNMKTQNEGDGGQEVNEEQRV